MENTCSHDCKNCKEACSSAGQQRMPFEPLHAKSSVKKVIAVTSGKGGVGKSLVTSLLGVALQKQGLKVAILDADITGPSIPKAFGIKEKATGTQDAIFPIQTKNGIQIMSINLLLDDETAPVIWRAPIITGVIKQFWSDVIWNDIDVMLIDMPPGTGDVPLTVFQSIPLSGTVIVTSPQELVSMIVSKSINMAQKMQIPVLGLVENMSYVVCPDCGKQVRLFGEGHVNEMVLTHGVPVLASLPIDPVIAASCDKGNIEDMDASLLQPVVDIICQSL